MDTDAQRRARQAKIKENLAEAYTDEEATPPEWVDLMAQAREEAERFTAEAVAEAVAFGSEPDIRRALDRREKFAAQLRAKIVKHNKVVERLNLLAPTGRFTRGHLDAEELLRPLFRTQRQMS